MNYDLDGVLVIREKLDQGLVSQAFAIKAVAAKGAGGPSLSLLAAMGLAVAGGQTFWTGFSFALLFVAALIFQRFVPAT